MFNVKAIERIVNGRKFRRITIMKPVEYYDKIEIDRDTREFYVTESGWDVIKSRYLDRYDAHGYSSRKMEIDDDNLIIFVDLKKEKDEGKAKKG